MVTTACHPADHRHPVHLAACGARGVVAVGVSGPSFAEVRLVDRHAVQLDAVPGACGGGWTDAGYLTWTAAGVVLWRAEDGSVERVAGTLGALATTTATHAWFRDGAGVARLDVASGEVRALVPRRPWLPGVTATPEATRVLLRSVEARDTSALVRADLAAGVERVWSEAGWCVEGVAPTGGGRWVATRMTADARRRQVVLLDADLRAIAVLHDESSGRGLVRWPPATASDTHAAYLAVVEGWPHVVVHDLASGRSWPALPGPHEDLTDVDDAPVFSPTGSAIAFNASHAHPRQRHLHVLHLDSGGVDQVTSAPGSTGAKAWLDDETLVVVQASVDAPADVRFLSGRSGEALRPAGRVRIGPELRAVRPVSIDLIGAGGTVPADLYLPPGFDDGRRHPALVYAHGGVFRHMTQGFSAASTYALLHLVNQRLLQLGYAVLSVDYRGSTGYGLAFEQANHDGAGVVDVGDCAAGGRWLTRQPWVRPSSVGIWGLSWGGTMTMGALVRHPDVFAAGVSLAGIWDFEQRAAFWNALQAGQPIYFDGRMPRRPAGAAGDPRHEASPRTHAARLRAPLLSFHGTADLAVDYAQQVLLERDAVALGLPIETVTFDGEAHAFTTADAWRVTVDRMEDFLQRTLGPPDA